MAKPKKTLKELMEAAEVVAPPSAPIPAQPAAPENPGLLVGKGAAGTSLEIGHGQGAIMSIDNTGPAKQVSLTTPFTVPKPTRILAPETDEPRFGELENEWSKLAKKVAGPNTAEPPPQAETPPEDPFGDFNMDESTAPEEPIPAQGLVQENAELKRLGEMAVERIQSLEGQLEALRASPRPSGQENGSLPVWEGKDLRVCFPCYKFTNPATAFVLLALALDFGRDRIGFIPGLGDARIANTRNRLADDFMRTGAQWCLMLDDDMIPTVGRVEMIRNFIGAPPAEVPDKVLQVHVVDRLLKSGQKLIGATYFGRRKYSGAMFKEGIDGGGAYRAAKTISGQVLPTEWVATGCLLIHRDVFLGIQKAFPALAPANGRPFWDYFQEGEGQAGGEDVMFCRRAKQAGFQPYVDTGAQCFHVGLCAWGFHNTENTLPANPRSQSAGWPGPRS